MSLGWRFDFAHEGGDIGAAQRSAAAQPRMVSGEALVRQALMLLLSTRPGERVMRPDWGCALDRVLFQPNDGATAGLAIHYVREAIARFEPRVAVLDIDATSRPAEPAIIALNLLYRHKASGQAETLSVDIDLDGSRA